MDFKTFLQAGNNRRAMLKGMGVAAVGFSLTGALAGCGEKEAKKLANGEEAKLNFYNWDTYIGETTLEDYKDSSGVDVNMTLFASNDELFAKLRAGNQGYDVIVPSNDFVERMAAADMLMPLDQTQIPNFKGCALRSGAEILDALHLVGARHWLPQVKGERHP
jgi:spermidine/putrescine transport system substrate-binding protein